jgi:hypothetical protein
MGDCKGADRAERDGFSWLGDRGDSEETGVESAFDPHVLPDPEARLRRYEEEARLMGGVACQANIEGQI